MSSFNPFAGASDPENSDSDSDGLIERRGNFNAYGSDKSKAVASTSRFPGQNDQSTPTSWLEKLLVIAGPATNAGETTHKAAPLSIADAIQDCTKLFCSILPLLPEESELPEPHPRASTDIDTTPPGVSELFDRYKIWYTNMGTYRNGLSSLDYRLRDASNVSKQVISLLSELDESLRDGKGQLLQFLRNPEFTKPDYGTDKIIKVLEVMSRDEGSSARKTAKHRASELDEQKSESSGELELILADINSIVDCLYRLSGVMEDPAPHDEIIHNATADMTNYVSHDSQFIRAKHLNISEDLAERLENAISVRRAYFGYRKEEYDNTQAIAISDRSQSAMKLTTRPAPNALESRDSPERMLRQVQEPIYLVSPQEQPSHESLASASKIINRSPASKHLYSNSRTSTGISRIALLLAGRMKKEGEREYKRSNPDSEQSFPSRCPLCWTNVYINVADWKKHFFSDLRPYMCIEANCRDPERLYRNDQEWISHVRHNHWMGWVCTAGCAMSFTQAADLEQHLRIQHANLADKHLNTLIELGERPGAAFHNMNCPLCFEELTTEVQYQQHIGQHLERLASLALPNEVSHDPATASTEIDVT
ncbi:hypothetical protein G7054_g8634 [Neopestalotiopsis clavispora]|nr:hypothetical protein G7054_g8634 [Neopestalotiopsis clavispora]